MVCAIDSMLIGRKTLTLLIIIFLIKKRKHKIFARKYNQFIGCQNIVKYYLKVANFRYYKRLKYNKLIGAKL